MPGPVKLPKIPPLPPPFDQLGRQIAIGLGRVATRAVTSGAKSVVSDVQRLGKNIQRAAERTGKKLDGMINPDDQDEEE
jgi:hypothetical protein